MSACERLSRIVLFLLLSATLTALAQPIEKPLEKLGEQLAAIPVDPPSEATDDVLTRYIVSAYDVLGQIQPYVSRRNTDLANLDARLAELGSAPAKGEPAEDPSVARHRIELQKSRASLDADIRRANLIGVDAQQAITRLIEVRRDRFTARITQRAESPLSIGFWSSADRAYPSDAERLVTLADELKADLGQSLAPAYRTASITGLLLALLLALSMWPMEQWLLRLTSSRVPPGRLRRSALALGVIAISVLIAVLSTQAAYKGLTFHAAFGDRVDSLAKSVMATLVFSAFVFGLSRALLSPRRASWRFPGIDDNLARRLRHLPFLLAAAIAIAWITRSVSVAIGASLTATVITQTFAALLLSGVIGFAVLRGRRRDAGNAPSDSSPDSSEGGPAPEASRAGLLFGIAGGVVLFVWIAIACGFIALGMFVAQQLAWACIVLAMLYVAITFADDLASTLLDPRGRAGKRLQAALSLRDRTLVQASVLLSGLSRVTLGIAALALVLVPFGTRPADLLETGSQIVSGWRIGEISIAPGAVGGALLVAVVGLFAVSRIKHWLNDRFLPHTDMEAGMRSSITTLLGYVGGIVVIAMAMSALGVGLERIAWIASALSVGIGFGLQAIVSNFISGLILLAERPVRVGDWVVVGDVEGDVRRINVRATEIQLGDRSTLIVPNSEFITKTVRNVTLAAEQGRVLVRLPMPLDCDAQRVRQLMLDCFNGHERVLDVPSPSVILEGIQNGALMFVGTAYVPSPRQATGVRSDVLFDLLQRLRAGGIELSSPQSLVLQTGTPQPARDDVAGTSS